jgi:hypothetical protein
LCGNGIFYARPLLISGIGFGALVLGHRIQAIAIKALVSEHLSRGVAN